MDNPICPNCKSTNTKDASIREDNGIIGPGYASWVVEEKYCCNDCGIYFKPVKTEAETTKRDNTQLPAEILKDIKDKALIHLQSCYTDGYVLERLEKENMPIGWKIKLNDFEAGAIEYAIKLLQAEEEIKRLTEWQERTKALLKHF